MNCLGLRRLETDYIDDLLSDAARREVAAHLHACGPCADRVRGIRELVGELALLPREPPPPDLYTRVLVAAAEPPTPAERWRLKAAALADLLLGWYHPALTRALAGVVLLVLVALAGFSRSQPAAASFFAPARGEGRRAGELGEDPAGMREDSLVTIVTSVGESGKPRRERGPEPVTMFIYARLDVRGF